MNGVSVSPIYYGPDIVRLLFKYAILLFQFHLDSFMFFLEKLSLFFLFGRLYYCFRLSDVYLFAFVMMYNQEKLFSSDWLQNCFHFSIKSSFFLIKMIWIQTDIMKTSMKRVLIKTLCQEHRICKKRIQTSDLAYLIEFCMLR